uniref:Uncharacterized protein n=1 Tax=Trichobilharzia regenti TaxID=157069 RepID=A0AA85K091_TRIRE|nr:unnamed protein product [Trichobilharzia regenti]
MPLQLSESESSCNPLYEDAPDDISSTLFDAQVVEVTSENVSETQKPGNFDPTDNLTPSSPALYDSILCSLQDDQLEDIPGLSDAYDSEESLSDLLELLNGEAFDHDVSTTNFN